MLKILSTAFNEWRRRAAIKPTNYKRRIIEAKPHMLKHNINMNAEDLLTGLRNQYNRKLRKDKLKKIVNKSDRNKLGLLDKAFQKWSNKTDIISLLKSKLISILRSRVNKIDLVRKIILKDALKKWLLKTKKNEGDILNRYGAMLRMFDLLSKSASRDAKKYIKHLET